MTDALEPTDTELVLAALARIEKRLDRIGQLMVDAMKDRALGPTSTKPRASVKPSAPIDPVVDAEMRAAERRRKAEEDEKKLQDAVAKTDRGQVKGLVDEFLHRKRVEERPRGPD